MGNQQTPASQQSHQLETFLKRLWAVKSIQRAIIAVVVALGIGTWTFVPNPVNAHAQVTIAVVSLAPGSKPTNTTVPTNFLTSAMSLTASFGPPNFDVGVEFPTFNQEISAVPGSAICTLAMWNVVGVHLVDSAISADVVRAAEGVSLANPRFFPAGHYLYSVTDLSEMTADVLTPPAPEKSLTEQLGIALGSRSGANLKNYTVYFKLLILQSGQVICLLQAKPSMESDSSEGDVQESQWRPPSQRRVRRVGTDPPSTSRVMWAEAH
ncbi:MAG: hypothetical protein ACRDID_08310 [Ktedonobacterales bacterium]